MKEQTLPRTMRRTLGHFLCILPTCAVALGAAACQEKTPPEGTSRADAGPAAPVQPGTPTLPTELARPGAPPAGSAVPLGPLSVHPKPPEHAGPWFVVTSPAAGVYAEPSFEQKQKIGWVRSGGKLAVKGAPASRKACTAGWYELVDGGYVCGNYGTTNLSSPDVKFAIVAPNLDDVLPYAYARNAKHGTPLYHSVPAREQMLTYEPYLADKEQKPPDQPVSDTVTADDKTKAPSVVTGATRIAPLGGDAGALIDPGLADAGIEVEAPEKPWWQQENPKDKLHELKLEHLESEADDILAKRMVTGFFVAVDRTFRWNDRTWYKTTKGLVAPAERFWQTAGPKFKGVELDGEKLKLPIAWGYGGRKEVATYTIDDQKQPKNAKSIEKHTAIPVTGKRLDIGKTEYVETTDGTYLKALQVRVTEPGPPPAGLGPDERWIDVDLSSQTIVAFVGTRPVYASLISSGKQSKIKDKDHRTPTGEFRIREKHITTTMDGDGTAAGDLPYSIEDVPYAMYFHRAYALHGAFWHSNYGVQMSHGCVNLAPLDAKWLYFFASPEARSGFHGMWARPETSGTRVVLHD
jgi:lipoprotein-anchoring transpeptidase ErfK/SrfK